ncbi:MAG: hypothetical protein RI910_2758 [Verrucomicrobiota bacterium]
MVIGGDDAVSGDGEAARQSVVPFGAFITFVGGADEHGSLGAAPKDVRAFERRSGERLRGKTNGIGLRAFTLFEPIFAAEGANALFRQGRGRGFELLEHPTAVSTVAPGMTEAPAMKAASSVGRSMRALKRTTEV